MDQVYKQSINKPCTIVTVSNPFTTSNIDHIYFQCTFYIAMIILCNFELSYTAYGEELASISDRSGIEFT